MYVRNIVGDRANVSLNTSDVCSEREFLHDEHHTSSSVHELHRASSSMSIQRYQVSLRFVGVRM